MTQRFGDLTPIRAAVEEIRSMESQASTLRAQTQQETLRDVRLKLEAALHDAENPNMSDGLSVEEYAQLEGVTRQAIYKRIRQGKLVPVRRPGGLRISRDALTDAA